MKKVFYFVLIMLSYGCTVFPDMTTLRQKYSWPEKKPACLENSHGWFSNGQQLKGILNADMKLIVELGSWLGSSTRFILNNAPNALVIAIDHWKGSEEHQDPNKRPELAAILPVLYETFLVNCWSYRERLIPMKTTTLLGLQEIFDHNLNPDLIYVDAAHDYYSVTKDLEKILELFPYSTICGDDWGWGVNLPVRRAVQDFAKLHSFSIVSEKNFWVLQKNI